MPKKRKFSINPAIEHGKPTYRLIYNRKSTYFSRAKAEEERLRAFVEDHPSDDLIEILGDYKKKYPGKKGKKAERIKELKVFYSNLYNSLQNEDVKKLKSLKPWCNELIDIWISEMES